MEDINESQDTAGGAQSNGILLRYSLICLLLFVVAAGIIYCIIHITFVEKKEWLDIAERERTRIPNRTLLPNRGNIYSSDGRLMATSFPRYRIYMDFRGKAIDSAAFTKKNGADSLAHYLSVKFKGDEKLIKKQLKEAFQRKAARYVVHNKRISFADLKEVKQFPFIALGKNKSGFIEETFVERQHPFGSLASRTVGDVYAALDSLGHTMGRNGLELQYDSLLRGKPGLKSTRREAGVWRDIPIVEAVNGMDIRSTIDIEIQDITEKALLNELRRTNAESGTIIIMEVKTGEVKAITNMGRTASGYGEDRNRAVADLLEPGSTFKVASIMVALEDGVCRPEDIVETGNGVYDYLRNGRPIRDHNANKGGYQAITVAESIWNSSNIGVAKVILKGYEHEPMKFINGLERLGLMEDLQIGIPGAGRSRIRKPSDKGWSKSSLPWMSFGYETQIPPIYTLAFYNAIANDGKMMRPLFVKEIMKEGKTVERFPPEVVKESICSGKTLRMIQDMLLGVVENGTGRPAYSPLVRIAGKTGTAQISEGGVYRGMGHQVSFAGYFPADRPVYSCIAVIRRPSSSFYPSGGAMSGGVIRNVAEKIYATHTRFDVRKLPVDSLAVLSPTPKVGIEEVKLKEGLVPRVIGMGAKDAVFLLEKAGLQVNLLGLGRVVSQSIPPGQQAVKGRTIAITLK
ncbi:MAG: transpeptidase family protein [Tannerellaceae bacterium]|jgi:cell division protein FtsI (penicillin-binding protein 3)|nr:transpeptidase family protein [Tannerellaceae bacterium]